LISWLFISATDLFCMVIAPYVRHSFCDV